MTSRTSTVGDAALEIVKKFPGSRVLPVPAGTKKATMKSWERRASADPAQIDEWFADDSLNIGFVTGDTLAIFDIEGPNKGLDDGPPGHIAIATMEEQFGKLPPTLTARTPSGGEHRYYAIPHPMAMQKKALGVPNVEFRTGDGVYCLLAPSRTDVGVYEWVDALAPVAELPPAWVEALDAFKPLPSTTATATTSNQALAAELKAQRETRFSKTRKEPQLESILRGCAWLRDCADNQASLAEPDWYAALSIVARCEGGERLAHAVSENHPSYNREETEAKCKQALEASGPRTCANIASEHCEGCIFAHQGVGWSPLTLGWHYPDMVDVLSTAVYATDDGVFLRLNDRERVSPSMFAASVQNIVKRNPRDQLLASSALVRVRKVDYLAGDDRLVVDGVANQWVRDGVLPAEGDCSVILDFLKYLIPIEREREYILDYLAHMVQKPSVKIAHGLMLTGLQGNGKSTFARILKRMLGRNARTVNGAELHGRFKNRFVDCQLLHIEEAHHGGRLEAYEQHKQLMTDEHFAVEEKNVPRWDGRTPRGVVMCTNDESGVVIPQGDRRWFIASTVDEKRDSRYFRELNEAIDDDAVIAAFAHQSEGRDIARFYPGAEPPMTEAKLRAMEATSTPLAQVLRMIRDEGVQPWTRKTFATMEDIMSSLRGVAFEVGALTPNKVAKALKDIGALQLKRLRLGGTRVRLWALDGDRKWASASEDEIRDRFEIDGAASLQGLGVSSLPSAIQEAIRAASRGVEA